MPLWRLNLLRMMFLVWFLAGLVMALPPLVEHQPSLRGMLQSMFAGLWVMSILGVRYPLQMLPIFLFEMAWKMIWLIAFGLPQWFGWAARSPRLQEDMLSIGTGPILFGRIVPWGYVWQHYVKQPGEPFRRCSQPSRAALSS